MEISYRLSGKWGYEDGGLCSPSFDYLIDVWGDVDEIVIGYCDQDNGEELEYNDEELSELKKEIIETVIGSVSLC